MKRDETRRKMKRQTRKPSKCYKTQKENEAKE